MKGSDGGSDVVLLSLQMDLHRFYQGGIILKSRGRARVLIEFYYGFAVINPCINAMGGCVLPSHEEVNVE